jgi:hypothetical protein
MRRAEALAKASISSSNPYNNIPIGDFAKDSSFGDVMYANIQDDKAGRLRDYRIMAAYSEVADALDEICDESQLTRMSLDGLQNYNIKILILP